MAERDRGTGVIRTVVTCDRCQAQMSDDHNGVKVTVTSRDAMTEFIEIATRDVCSGCVPALGAFLGLIKDGK